MHCRKHYQDIILEKKWKTELLLVLCFAFSFESNGSRSIKRSFVEMFALLVWTWFQSYFFFIFFKAFRYDVLLFNPEIKLDSRYMFNIFVEKREKNREKLCSTAMKKKRVKELENGKSKASICCMWCGACIWRKKEEETSGFVILIYLICTSLFHI